MVGQLVLSRRGRGKAQAGSLYGLNVLRAEADPDGFWAGLCLSRAGRGLRLGGALRVLVPHQFSSWPVLERFGLRPVDPTDFVRAQSVPLALEALERQGIAPDRATVALRGLRADRDMLRTAAQLCPQVRRLVVDAPQGGAELARWLRREFGVPILPRNEAGQVALGFQPGPSGQEETCLQLYGPRPDLAGLSLCGPELDAEDQNNLSLLAVLWESGKLRRLKIT